jgi:hypothetical protein
MEDNKRCTIFPTPEQLHESRRNMELFAINYNSLVERQRELYLELKLKLPLQIL